MILNYAYNQALETITFYLPGSFMKTKLLFSPVFFSALAITGITSTQPVVTYAGDLEFNLTIKNHRFEPTELRVPANKKIKILVDNQDTTPEEFHSDSLKREKVIAGKSKGVVLVGPLKAGSYSFMGEFHEATAKGIVIAQ